MAKLRWRQLEGVLLKQTTVVKVLFDALFLSLLPAKFEFPQKVSIKIFSEVQTVPAKITFCLEDTCHKFTLYDDRILT